MLLWTLKIIYRRPALYACEAFPLQRWLQASDRRHWRFAHTSGGLPSLIMPFFTACVLFCRVVQDHACYKEEDDHARCITTRA